VRTQAAPHGKPGSAPHKPRVLRIGEAAAASVGTDFTERSTVRFTLSHTLRAHRRDHEAGRRGSWPLDVKARIVMNLEDGAVPMLPVRRGLPATAVCLTHRFVIMCRLPASRRWWMRRRPLPSTVPHSNGAAPAEIEIALGNTPVGCPDPFSGVAEFNAQTTNSCRKST
jgi:hypothetical protein